MIFHLFKKNSGFTSLELLVATSITGIFAVSYFTAFHVMESEMYRNKIYFDANISAKKVMDRVSKDAQEALNVAASWGGNTTGNTCLVLRLPAIDASGSPTNTSTQFDYVTYRINPSNSTQLLRSLDVLAGVSQREGGADVSNVVVAERVSSILFSSGGTSLGSVSSGSIPLLEYINVQITTQGTTVGTTQQTVVDSDITLRNRIT